MKHIKKIATYELNSETMKTEWVDKEVEIEDTFTAYNLEAHQTLNLPNIIVMREYAEQMPEGFAKSQLKDFLKRLENQSIKLEHALCEFEKNIGTSKEITIPVEVK